jgi:hypothetical protein
MLKVNQQRHFSTGMCGFIFIRSVSDAIFAVIFPKSPADHWWIAADHSLRNTAVAHAIGFNKLTSFDAREVCESSQI